MTAILRMFTVFSMILTIMAPPLAAQDLKVKKLYQEKEYCKCVERCEKVLLKKSSAEVLYYKAASLIYLYKTKDSSCVIPNLLKRSMNALSRLNKCKKDTSGLGIKLIETEIVSACTSLYKEEMELKKWKSAIGYIDVLLAYKPQCNYYFDKAFCAYFLSDRNAIMNLSEALHCLPVKDAHDTSGLFSRLFGLMKVLEHANRLKEHHQLFDTLMSYYPGNSMLVSEVNTNLLQKLYRYKHQNQYDSLLEYAGWLSKSTPGNKEVRARITHAVISVADSLADLYSKSDTSIGALTNCLKLLSDARILLGEYIEGLRQTKYYSLKPDKTTKFIIESRFDNDIGFRADPSTGKDYTLNIKNIRTLVPCRAIGEVPGYLWKDAPKPVRARSAKELLKKETLNYYLLDSLTHIYCNKFRGENSKTRLKWSSSHYRASKHHALVMASANAIWHGENVDSSYADIDSIKLYLRLFWGENCQYIGMGSEKYTYDEFANDLIENWKSSPGHRRNMLDDYTVESVSTIIASKDNASVALTNEKIVTKYLPEYKKFFEILPGFQMAWINFTNRVAKPTSYSSQNFR